MIEASASSLFSVSSVLNVVQIGFWVLFAIGVAVRAVRILVLKRGDRLRNVARPFADAGAVQSSAFGWAPGEQLRADGISAPAESDRDVDRGRSGNSSV